MRRGGHFAALEQPAALAAEVQAFFRSLPGGSGMKAVGFTQRALLIEHAQALVDLDLPDPGPPQGRDLLVRVHGVSVNPRDMKSRMTMEASPARPVVLGYDASGVVEAVGPGCNCSAPAMR